MADQVTFSTIRIEQGVDRNAVSDRRFHRVVVFSILLHIAAAALFAFYETRLAGIKHHLIMVDMAALPLPEPKIKEASVPPEPVRSRPREQRPATEVLPKNVRPVLPPAVSTSPVPVAAIGESLEQKHSTSRAEMTVPVVRRSAETSRDASAMPAQTSPVKAADDAERLHKARISYRAVIAALIDRHKEYPLFARKSGQQGTCCIRCTMMCDGTVKRVELVKSSGYEALDKAGLRAVSSVEKFPPPPHDGGCTEVSFEVPISFRLG